MFKLKLTMLGFALVVMTLIVGGSLASTQEASGESSEQERSTFSIC